MKRDSSSLSAVTLSWVNLSELSQQWGWIVPKSSSRKAFIKLSELLWDGLAGPFQLDSPSLYLM